MLIYSVYDGMAGMTFTVVASSAEEAIRFVFEYIGEEERGARLAKFAETCIWTNRMSRERGLPGDLAESYTDADYLAEIEITGEYEIRPGVLEI